MENKDIAVTVESIINQYINFDGMDYNSELLMDSLELVKIIVDIEVELDIEIPSEYLLESKWKTINEITTLVRAIVE